MKLSFLALVLVLFSACASNSKTKVALGVLKTDSNLMVYKDKTQGPFIVMVKYQIVRTFIPVDSQSTKGQYHIDTFYVGKIPNPKGDTLKDATGKPLIHNHHPILDSLFTPLLNHTYLQRIILP